MKDLHIHLERGPYTLEWIDKFVEQAVKMQLDEINLLEHSIRIKELHPCFQEAREYNLYQKRWFEGKQKQAQSLNDYKALIDKVRAQDYPIKISFGMEVCWFEHHADLIEKTLCDGYFDYLIGSVHWIDNWTFNQRKYQWLGKDVNQIYRRYYELSNALIKSGLFDIIAHPDLVRCHGLYPDYDLTDTYVELCQNAKVNHVMIEMNTSKSLGINRPFFEIAKSCGAAFSTGSDAHRPEDVGKGIAEVTKLMAK